MPITVTCTCGKSYPIRDEFAGQLVKCPVCAQLLTIPIPPASTRPTKTPTETTAEYEDILDVVPADDLDDLVVMDRPPRRKRTGLTVLLGLLTLMFVLCGGFGIVVAAVVIAGRDSLARHSAPSTLHSPEPPPVDNPVVPMPSLPELPPPSARPFDGHQSPIIALSFSHSGNFAFSAAGGFDQVGGRATLLPDNTLRAWDVKTGKETLRARNFRDGIAAAAFSADGHYAVLAGAGHWNGNAWSPVPDGLLYLWDLHKDQEVRVFRGHTKPVTCLAFSANGTRILSGSADNTVRLWNVETATEVYRLEGHTNTVNSVAFSSDGNYGLSGSADTTVRLWDLNAGTETRKLLGHQAAVLAVAISPTGKLAASGGGAANAAKDVDIRLWDLDTGQELRRCRGHEKAIGCLAFSADGRRLISGAADKTVMLWQVANAEPLGRLDGHLDRVRAVAFFPDGKRALSGGEDRMLRVWDLPPDLHYWIDRLEDSDRLTRLDAARQLPRFGTEVRASLPQLLKAMVIDDNDLQLALLTVLAKLGPPSKSDAVLLSPLFKNVELPAVRLYALDSMAAQGADYPLTLPMLKDALADKDPTVKRRAVLLGGQLGAPARETLYPALLEMLKANDEALSKEAGDALAKLGKPTEQDLPVLNDLLRDQRPTLRRYAVIALGDLGPAAEKDLPRLKETFLVDKDPEMRRLALIALCKVQPNLKEIGRFLKDGLKDESTDVNKEAVAISAALAPEPEPLAILLESLNHPKPVVAKSAEDALIQVKFDRPHEKGLAAALRACKSESARLRLMDALVALKPETSESGAALASILKDAAPENRSKIIAAIGQLGKAGREAGPGLAALLKADDRLTRFEAAVALCKIQSDLADKAVPPLVAALRVEKPDDTEGLARQLEAHKALVALGKPAVDALADSLSKEFFALGKEFFAGNPKTLMEASKADARLAVINTLAAIGADAKGAIQALGAEEKEDPYIPNRKVAKEARLKIQQLADEKDKQR